MNKQQTALRSGFLLAHSFAPPGKLSRRLKQNPNLFVNIGTLETSIGVMTLSKRSSEELLQAYIDGDPTAYPDIKNDMEHLVRTVARRYADEATEEELLPIGMTYFDLALRKYLERRPNPEKIQEPYKFSTYFTWWIRESIHTYLGRAKIPLKGIIPRA